MGAIMSFKGVSSSESSAERPGLIDRLKALFAGGQSTSRSEIEDVLQGSSADNLSAQERKMLKSVLGLHELRVRDIMVPRADIIAVAMDDNLQEILDVFRTAGHSRLPVYGATLDDPRGMIHIRDFVGLIFGPEQQVIENAEPESVISENQTIPASRIPLLSQQLSNTKLLRTVLFAPPSMPILNLLLRMQAERIHMALVIDEYGGTDGLVSIEDVVEVIVGDIEDEHDEEEDPRIELRENGTFVIDGRASLADVVEKTGISLDSWADTDEIDTMAGLVSTIAGRVPGRGEVIRAGAQWEFHILDSDPRKIKLIAMKKVSTSKDQQPASSLKRES